MNSDQGRQEFSNTKVRHKRRKRQMFTGLCIMLVLFAVFLLLIDLYVAGFSRGLLYHSPADIPHRSAALVLGCSKYAFGRQNLFYNYRIDAAIELWQAGKVDAILVSGDNSRKDYDEPGAIKADLVARGIPAEFITLDYAGFSTLDSVLRAKQVFGLDDYIVVSQPFHCRRAVFLAQKSGQSVIAFCAANPSGLHSTKVRLREVLARVKAVVDITLSRGPKYLGPAEKVRFRQTEIHSEINSSRTDGPSAAAS